jgi:hypothetical protein
VKVGGGQILGMSLMGTPLHEQAVTDAAEQTGDEHGWGAANPAAVVVMGNVQALVEAIFDAAKASPVEFQPSLCVEFAWFSAGQQGDVFILAAVSLAQQSGRLRHQRKANLLSGDGLS